MYVVDFVDAHCCTPVLVYLNEDVIKYVEDKYTVCFLDSLQTKTPKEKIFVFCSEYCPFYTSTYNTRLHVFVDTKNYILPCCTDVEILCVTRSCCVI